MTKEIALAVWVRGDRMFLQRRPLNAMILPGLWEFPGGKVEEGEVADGAAAREFTEEVGLPCQAQGLLGERTHTYAHGAVHLRAFAVKAEGRPRTPLAWGWFTQEEAARLAMPEANQGLLAALPRISS